MSHKFQVTKAAQLQSLAQFRSLIKEAAHGHPEIDDQVVYDLQLAVDEACTNIITHGYAGMDPGSIIFSIEITAGKVVMTITDFGHEFEPSNAPMPDVTAELEDRPMGGFGLYFIYQTMDQVDYSSSTAGNQLTLTKYLPGGMV